MRRRRVDRHPRGITLGGRIVVNIAVADRRHRPPEQVVPFCFEHGHGSIELRHRHNRHEAGTVRHRHVLGLHDLAQYLVGDDRAAGQPESRILGLLCGAFGAVAFAEFLNLL